MSAAPAATATAACEHPHGRVEIPKQVRYDIPVTMFAENRARFVARFRAAAASSAAVAGERELLVFQGGESKERYDSDTEVLFRQESNFFYLFGIREPDAFGAIDAGTGRAIGFFARLPESYAVWLGPIKSLEALRTEYGLDEAHYVDELAAYLLAVTPTAVYVNAGVNSDSKRAIETPRLPAEVEGRVRVDAGERLHVALCETRVVKSAAEQSLLRFISKVTSAAHVEAMRSCVPGLNESQLEARFLYECYSNAGCRFTAYPCICGSGPAAATLHYVKNDVEVRDGGLVLSDMGAEYSCYCTDVTCTYPANGRFSADQRAAYETVLAARNAVLAAMKPGVSWVDMHRLAYRHIAEGLLKMQLLTGSVDELLDANIPALFMPHGLGHLLGLDTHDVGGYLPGLPERPKLAGYSSLRTARTLIAGMFITVEPGLYFIRPLLEPALKDPAKSRFLNEANLARFLDFGGIRIEDDVLVTETGAENFTNVPRTVQEIEAVMAGGAWKIE